MGSHGCSKASDASPAMLLWYYADHGGKGQSPDSSISSAILACIDGKAGPPHIGPATEIGEAAAFWCHAEQAVPTFLAVAIWQILISGAQAVQSIANGTTSHAPGEKLEERLLRSCPPCGKT